MQLVRLPKYLRTHRKAFGILKADGRELELTGPGAQGSFGKSACRSMQSIPTDGVKRTDCQECFGSLRDMPSPVLQAEPHDNIRQRFLQKVTTCSSELR